MARKPRSKSFAEIYVEATSSIGKTGLKSNPETNYPLFGFKYLDDVTHKDCGKGAFFVKFLERLNKLSSLGWAEIAKSDRHSFGTEKIDIDVLRPAVALPDEFKTIRRLTVFRATGDNHVFAGVREGNTFHILFIESEFGLLYDHD